MEVRVQKRERISMERARKVAWREERGSLSRHVGGELERKCGAGHGPLPDPLGRG
jgi:hypothetical protein